MVVVNNFDELTALGHDKVAGKSCCSIPKFDKQLAATGHGGQAYGQAVIYRAIGAALPRNLGHLPRWSAAWAARSIAFPTPAQCSTNPMRLAFPQRPLPRRTPTQWRISRGKDRIPHAYGAGNTEAQG